MTYAYIICIVDILLDPIVGCHLAIRSILGTDVVASVITLHPRHFVFEWRHSPSHMNREQYVI